MIGAAAPTTYQELYDEMPDPLFGDYSTLYTKFMDPNESEANLLTYAMLTGDDPPMVYLALADQSGEPVIKVLHRLTPYKVGPRPTPYDGHGYAFCGDVVGGAHIDMVKLPMNAFERLEVVVRPAEDIDAEVITWSADEDEDYLDPIEVDDDSELVTVPRMIPVPQMLLNLVFSRQHTPASLWRELGGVIKTEGLEDQVEPFLNWMQAALQAPAEDAIPEISFGDEEQRLPLAGGKRLHDMRLKMFYSDFPHLKPGANSGGSDDKFLEALNKIEQARNLQHNELMSERKAARAPKTVEEKFPYSVRYYLRIAGVGDPVDLPPVYAELAKANKNDKRLVLQRMVADRLEQPGATGPGVPIITKNLTDMIVSGELGTESAIDDLTQGLHPYTCGHVQGPDGEKIQAMAVAFDRVMDGELTPTVTEHILLTSTEVRFPDRDWTAREMIRATSVVLDVVQGVRHPHARAFQEFADKGYEKIITAINNMAAADRAKYGNVHPCILREVQYGMVLYFQELLAGSDPDLPRYNDIVNLVKRRRFDQLQPLPHKYVDAPKGKSQPGGDLLGGPKKGDKLGARVDNSEPTDRNWQTLYQNSGKKLATLAPRSPKDDEGEQCCLSYHLKGFCYENCPRAKTHCVLVGTLKRKMVGFVAREFPKPQDNPTPKKTGDDGDKN